jgi:hypothetical protein
MTAPALSLICSTIGRPTALHKLLDSIAASDGADRVEFVLVDQSPDRACTAVLHGHRLRAQSRTATSGRGVSVGRNTGLEVATAPVVAFPNDNCWYPPETFGLVLTALDQRPELAGVSGMQVTSDGNPSMLRWLSHSTLITRTNFMRTAISSTMFLRRRAMPPGPAFDESMGTGAPGICGSGEESDLLLRMLSAGRQILYRPDIHVHLDDPRDEITEAFVEKMFKYGVGNGNLWRRHRLSLPQLAYHASRKLVGSGVRAARGDRIVARADIAYLRGQIVGLRGIAEHPPQD